MYGIFSRAPRSEATALSISPASRLCFIAPEIRSQRSVVQGGEKLGVEHLRAILRGRVHLHPEEKGPERRVDDPNFRNVVDREGHITLQLAGGRAEGSRVILETGRDRRKVARVAHRKGVPVVGDDES